MIRDDIWSVAINGNIFRIGEPNTFSGFESQEIVRTPTRIAKSERNGQMASVPYIEIWAGDLLWIEIDAGQCQGVEYFEPDPRPDLTASPTGADAFAMAVGGPIGGAMAPINITEISLVDLPAEIMTDYTACTTPPEIDCNDPACPVHGVPL